MTIETSTGWFAIMNGNNYLSELKPNVTAAREAVRARGDRSECTIREASVIIGGTVPNELPKKTKSKKKKGAEIEIRTPDD